MLALWKHYQLFEQIKENEIFEQCYSAENCKRGTIWDFLTSILLQFIETLEAKHFGAIQNFRKSLIVTKSLSEKHQDNQKRNP